MIGPAGIKHIVPHFLLAIPHALRYKSTRAGLIPRLLNTFTTRAEANGMEQSVILETASGIARVFFNDPKTFNAFNLDTITRFADCIISLAYDDDIRGLIISGRGKAFCTGGDLGWASSHPRGAAAAFHELSSRFHQSIAEIRNMSKPVVAAVNGIAAGGGFSLALACDFRIMAKSGTLKQGFTSNGLSIDGGGTFTLPRLVGLARALEIAAFDEPLSAETALRAGLVNRVVDDRDLMAEAEQFIRKILSISPHSYGWSKQLFNHSLYSSFESQLELERRGLSACAAHRDGIEGIRAFMEKRKPKFD